MVSLSSATSVILSSSFPRQKRICSRLTSNQQTSMSRSASLALYPALNLHFLPRVLSLFLKGHVLQNPPFETSESMSQRVPQKLTATKLSLQIAEAHTMYLPWIVERFTNWSSRFLPHFPLGSNYSTHIPPLLSIT